MTLNQHMICAVSSSGVCWLLSALPLLLTFTLTGKEQTPDFVLISPSSLVKDFAVSTSPVELTMKKDEQSPETKY